VICYFRGDDDDLKSFLSAKFKGEEASESGLSETALRILKEEDPNKYRNYCVSARTLERYMIAIGQAPENIRKLEKFLSLAFAEANPHHGQVEVNESGVPVHPRYSHRGTGRNHDDLPVTHNTSKPDPDALKCITVGTRVVHTNWPYLLGFVLRLESDEYDDEDGYVMRINKWACDQGVNHSPSGDRISTEDRWFGMLSFLKSRPPQDYHRESIARSRITQDGVPVADLLEYGIPHGHHRHVHIPGDEDTSSPDVILMLLRHEEQPTTKDTDDHNKHYWSHGASNAYEVVRDSALQPDGDVVMQPSQLVAPMPAATDGTNLVLGERLRSRDRVAAPHAAVKGLLSASQAALDYVSARLKLVPSVPRNRDASIAVITNWSADRVRDLRPAGKASRVSSSDASTSSAAGSAASSAPSTFPRSHSSPRRVSADSGGGPLSTPAQQQQQQLPGRSPSTSAQARKGHDPKTLLGLTRLSERDLDEFFGRVSQKVLREISFGFTLGGSGTLSFRSLQRLSLQRVSTH
jgi:hypothetical protein